MEKGNILETDADSGTLNPNVPLLQDEERGKSQIHLPEFTGDAGEYFRIWIINMLLSLLTLGIYSAWATVRNRRYLFGSTEVDGDRFDFHGKPLAILRGRILAVGLFSAYLFGGDLNGSIPAIAFIVLVISFPWILVKAMQFRLGNTSWRNLRFGFRVTTGQVYRVLALPLVLGAIAYAFFFWFMLKAQGSDGLTPDMTLFSFSFLILLLSSIWLVPALSYRIRNLLMNHLYFGDHRFQADIEFLVFFKTYLKTLGMGVVAVIVGLLITAGNYFVLSKLFSIKDMSSIMVFFAVSYSIMILVYLLPFAIWQVLTANYVIGATCVRSLRFRMEMKVSTYWWILLSNAVVAVLSVGLAIPWTKIRMIRYKLSCMRLEGDLGNFCGSQQLEHSAVGDEIGDAFDIDFGF